MGVVDSAKDLYFHLEDRYYRLIDRINSRVLYKIVDKVDSVVPSFALVLLVIFVLIALGIMFVLTQGISLPVATSELVVKVQDEKGNPLKGVGVEFTAADGTEHYKTTDAEGKTPALGFATGSEVEITLSKDGYAPKPYSAKFKVSEPFVEKLVELEEEKAFDYIKFKIMDELFQPVDKVWVEFDCSESSAEDPAGMFSSQGIVEVAVPKNCGELRVDASAPGYEELTAEEVVDNATIFLQEKEDERGTIVVSLTSHGELAADEQITVSLYKDTGAADGINVESKETTTGQAEFSAAPGTYYVKSLSTAKYTVKESLPFELEARARKDVTLELEERVIGKIKVKVLDEKTGKAVENAGVTFKKGTQQVFYQETNEQGIVEFNLHEDIGYTLIVNHEDYCIVRRENVRKSNDTLEIEIEKYTGQCGGVLLARVLDDETGKGMEHATVGLYDEQGYSAGFKPLLTDINGEAEFAGVETGDYQVFAYKGSASGWSDIKKFVRREAQKTVYTVSLTIPLGAIRVRVLDDELEPLPFADVALKRAFDNKLLQGPMPVEDANGWIEFLEKSGEDVFAVVSMEGYTDFTSSSVRVLPNSTREIVAELEPEIISGEIEAEFLGLYKNGRKATILGAGQEYDARFQLRIPKNQDYEFIGMHIRTGKENTMEKDMVFIKEHSAPAAPIISKGTSFNPEEGFDYDSQFKTADGAKWMNFKWGKFSSGKFNVEVTVKVKDLAKQGEQVPVYWRAWAKKEDDGVVRDPEDQTLGSTMSQNELYANTDSKLFQVGIETLCADKWCFAGSILDVEDEIIQSVSDSYGAIVGKQYRLSFKILNDSPFETDIFDNAKMRVVTRNSAILLQDYQIIGPQGSKTEGSANASSLDWIEIGDLTPSKDVSGTIYFTPKSAVSSSLLLQVHSRYRIVFEKEITVDSAAANEMDVKFKKEGEYVSDYGLLPSGVEQTLTVKVFDKASELELEGATVKIIDRFGSVLGEEKTTFFGIADVVMPVLKPGEKLTMSVQKANYMPLEKALSVDDRVLEVEPAALNVTLNAQTAPEKSINVTLKNKTSLELEIEWLEVTGDFQDLVDKEKTGQWLYSQYSGEKISGKESRNIVLKMFLTDLGKSVKETRTLKGKFNARVFSSGQTWEVSKDLTVVIGLGGEVDDTACFSLSTHSWKAATEISPRNKDVMIVNNCSVDGKPVELQNLSAKIVWESNHLGEFKFGIDGENSIEIRPGFFKIFRKSMGKEETLPGILSFIPDGGNLGTAKATVIVQAKNPTQSGEQLLEDSIEVEITVVSLDSCLRVSRDLLKLAPNDEGTFEISTGDCGGNVDIRLISELTVGNKEITMGSNDSHTVTVLSEERIPGQYPIYIKFRAAGKNEYEVGKLVRVLIEPTEGCIRLNRYEYDIYDSPDNPYDGFDVGKIINSCPSQRVAGVVRFNEKNLCKAVRNGFVGGLIGMIYGGLQASNMGRGFFGIGPTCSEQGGVICGTGTKCSVGTKIVYGKECCIDGECVKVETAATQPAEEPEAEPEEPAEEAEEPGEAPAGEPAEGPAFGTCAEMGGEECEPNQDCMDGETKLPFTVASDIINCCIGGTCTDREEEQGEEPTLQSCAELGGEPCNGGTCAPPLTGITDASYPQMVDSLDGECCVGGRCITAGEELTCEEQGGSLCPGGICQVYQCDGEGCNPVNVEPTIVAGEECCLEGACVYEAQGKEESGSAAGMVALGAIDVSSVLGPLAEGLGGLLDIDNFLEGLFVGWVANSAYNYLMVQQEGKVAFDVVADDLAITALRVLYPSGREDNDAPGISAELGAEKTERSTELELGRRETEIIFENSDGITQENPVSPIYRILKVEGEKREYETDYGGDAGEEGFFTSLWNAIRFWTECPETEFSEEDAEQFIVDGGDLEVKESEEYFQKFHLQFNSYEPEEPTPTPVPGESCKIGTRVGKTGEEAMPSILLKWNWSDIQENTCDEGGGETYCDATQFSIELLKRIHGIEELLAGQTFTCPSESGVLEDVSQALSESEEDVAITRVKVEKEGGSATVEVTIESNNNKEMEVRGTIKLIDDSTGNEINCPGGVLSVDVVSRNYLECSFTDLAEGTYTVEAEISPQLNTCSEECKNLDTGNDSLNAKLTVGEESNVFRVCEPYSTTRLGAYLTANPGNAALEEAAELANFKALLIRDGYTKDFRADFDEYCETKDFFNAPSYYLGDSGLARYFIDDELFSFKSYFLESIGYVPEGKYQVDVDIVYGDNSWSLFKEGEPNAVIEIELSKLDTPRPNSPFYYMPFDGLVGVDSENGRQGYGVNFKEESPATLMINEDPEQLIYSSTIAHSSPVPGAWVYTNRIEDFRTLNNTRRGVILDIVRNPDLEETTINLSPSNATPVILKVSGGQSDKAFAFYNVTVDGEPQQVGSYLTSWTGIGKYCYDFEDNEMTETYQETHDVHGGVGVTECAGTFSTASYGLEWCDIKRKGNVFLKTMFFTPTESESILNAVEGLDSMSFVSPTSSGTEQVFLNGTHSHAIESVERILNLVRAEEVCVTGYGNEVRTTFFWNPEKVLENSLGEEMENAVGECIAPFKQP